jgi:hypothetical protein
VEREVEEKGALRKLSSSKSASRTGALGAVVAMVDASFGFFFSSIFRRIAPGEITANIVMRMKRAFEE